MRRGLAHAMVVVGAFAVVACGRSAGQAPPAPADQAAPLAAPPTPSPRVEPAPVPALGATLAPPNESFKEFQDRVKEYLALREKVASGLPKLKETGDPRKIADRSAQLAAGIRDARRDATQGTVFTRKVAAELRRIFAADAASRTPADRVNIMAEVPSGPPVVNAQYPTDSPKGPAALPSFPPKLLAVLPELPETLEYRFLGQALVLRDATANLIVDYLPDVAPARLPGGERP